MITAVAIIIDGEVKQLPRPYRHHHITHKWPLPEHHHGEQGFIDDEKGFVSREEAYIIALNSGQLEGRQKTGNLYDGKLYSEDLW